MSNEVTSEHLAESIAPGKTDQLNADDFLVGAKTVTITAVKAGSSKEQPIVIVVAEESRPYKPCKSMRRVLIAHFGDDAKQWIGQQLTLYCDPSVVYGGVRVGGIRISHASGLMTPKTFMLTKTRGSKAEFTLLPLPYVADVLKEIATATNADELAAIGQILQGKSEAIKATVRGAYAARKKALEATKGETQCGQ